MHRSQSSLDLTDNIYKAHMRYVRFLRFWSKRSSFFSLQIWFHPKDFDDCSMWGVCDQLCEDRTGSHHCSCREGYVLEQHRYCRADLSGKSYFLSPSLQTLHVPVTSSNWLYERTVVLSCGSENHCGWLTEYFCLGSCCCMFVLLEPELTSTGNCSSGFHLMIVFCHFHTVSAYCGCNISYSVYLQLESLLWYSLMAEIC